MKAGGAPVVFVCGFGSCILFASINGTRKHPPPRFHALALFGRPPLRSPNTLVMPATEPAQEATFASAKNRGVQGLKLVISKRPECRSE